MNNTFQKFHAKIDGEDTRLLLAAKTNRKSIIKHLVNSGVDINCSDNQNDSYTALHYASEKGWFEIVQFLLNKSADINVQTKWGESPILLAAKNGHKNIVKLLVNSGADVNCSSRHNNYTVLHYASEKGWLEIVQCLLNKGADIHVKSYEGYTPLLLAAECSHKNIVEFFIDAGADIKYSGAFNSFTLLHYVASIGWLDIVQTLLKKGVCIGAKNAKGYTALLLAAKNSHKDIVEHLLNSGADVNCSDRKNETVLQYASKKGWLKIVQSLLNKGADIHVQTECGESPLFLAVKNRHKDIAELLINAGADINCHGAWKSYTVLHCATDNGLFEVVKSLLNKGADIQAKTNCGESALLFAANSNRKDIVELLINAGADVNCTRTWNNYTVLHYALRKGWLNIVQSLLKKGADIHAKNDEGYTALLLAARKGHKNIVKLLIYTGANIKGDTSPNNYTVLNWASRKGWVEIVQSLLKKGVDIEAKSWRGETSLKIAIDYDRIETAEHLINAGADVNAETYKGDSILSTLIRKSPDMKLVKLLIKSGAYLKPIDYKIIIENSLLKENILLDSELCSQAIINKFNHKDLPELYKLSMACKILPCLEHITIANDTQDALEVLHSVKHEIQGKGYCNVLEVRPKVLKMLSVKTFLSYSDNIKKQNNTSNPIKRSAEADYDNQHSSKMMRFNK